MKNEESFPNGRKKLGKEEIACHEQVLLFSMFFNSLPNDKVVDLSNLNVFADDKIYVTKNLKFVLGRVENIMGKGKKLVTSIFSFSRNVFKRLFLQGC